MTTKQYKKLIELIDWLMNQVGRNKHHELGPLLDLVANLIVKYEKRYFKNR